MFGLRLRLMSLLDRVMHRQAHETVVRLVQADDAARVERVGPQDEAVRNLKQVVGG